MTTEKQSYYGIAGILFCFIAIELTFYLSLPLGVGYGEFEILRIVIATLIAAIFLLLGRFKAQTNLIISGLWLVFTLLEYYL